MKSRILLINDDDFVREIIATVLQRYGYEIIEAEGGKKGIEAAISQVPDLILLDVMMPDLDGYEVCIQLKKNPETQEIPILFLSSLREAQDKIKGLKIGGVDFIDSLADQGELLARVQTHLQIQSLSKHLIQTNKELSHKQKVLEEDLKAAAYIQRGLLPARSEKFADISFAWAYLPCNLVGGDLFDVFQIDADHIAFYILDVSGHDVTSAMVTLFISQFILEQSMKSSDPLSPKHMLITLQKEYPLERFNRFFTIFYAVLNVKTGKLTYSSAGHPPAIILKENQKFELLDLAGIIIGYDASFEFGDNETELQKGDKILLYTDGVTDIQNQQNEFFGSQRYFALLEKLKNLSLEELIKQTLFSLKEFRQGVQDRDDICILGLEIKD